MNSSITFDDKARRVFGEIAKTILVLLIIIVAAEAYPKLFPFGLELIATFVVQTYTFVVKHFLLGLSVLCTLALLSLITAQDSVIQKLSGVPLPQLYSGRLTSLSVVVATSSLAASSSGTASSSFTNTLFPNRKSIY